MNVKTGIRNIAIAISILCVVGWIFFAIVERAQGEDYLLLVVYIAGSLALIWILYALAYYIMKGFSKPE